MSTLSTLIDSYGDLANRYAALEDENAALKARVKELEHEANKYAAICNDLHKEIEELHVSKYEDDDE